VLATLKGRARALFAAGRFVEVTDGHAVFALPDPTHRDRCEAVRADVEAALAAHFGIAVPLRLVADVVPTAEAEADDEHVSYEHLAELRDAPPETDSSPADRIKSAFPGAEEVPS
jgi:hypothetical protein